jgi:hypothetical protein
LFDNNSSMLGGCKLLCLILGKYDTPQSPYFNINFFIKKPMLYEDYMVTNELIESQWMRHQLNNFLTYMLEKTNINPTKESK